MDAARSRRSSPATRGIRRCGCASTMTAGWISTSSKGWMAERATPGVSGECHLGGCQVTSGPFCLIRQRLTGRRRVRGSRCAQMRAWLECIIWQKNCRPKALLALRTGPRRWSVRRCDQSVQGQGDHAAAGGFWVPVVAGTQMNVAPPDHVEHDGGGHRLRHALQGSIGGAVEE